MTKQIKIEELIPFLREGWIAMDKSGLWHYFTKEKPEIKRCNHCGYSYKWANGSKDKFALLPMFNIKPAEDWENSLIKVGGKK